MGYLRERTINGENKLYWIVSKREGKKEGGSGNVKKIEYYLGKKTLYYIFVLDNESYVSDNYTYLSWYLWNNDFKLDEFINKFIAFEINNMLGGSELDFSLSKQKKVIFIKKNNSKIDLRKSYYKRYKTYINKGIEDIIKGEQFFPLMIEEIISNLTYFNCFIKKAKEVNKKTDIDDFIKYEQTANEFYGYALKELEKMLNYVPRTQREEAKKKIWRYCLSKCPLERLDL